MQSEKISREEIIKSYLEAGFQLVLVHRLTQSGICACQNGAKCQNTAKHPVRIGWKEVHEPVDTFNKYTKANVGIATGKNSKVFVLDNDPRHGGNESLELLEQKHGKLPKTPSVHTGGGGGHYYFSIPDDIDIPNCVGLLPGIDIRGDGGLVVAPPSIHASGKRYEWVKGCSLFEIPIAKDPEWLVSLISEGNQDKHKGVKALPERIPDGERNVTMTSLAGSLRRRNASEEGILAALRVENERCDSPLGDEELMSIARSVGRYDAPKCIFEWNDEARNNLTSSISGLLDYSKLFEPDIIAMLALAKENESNVYNAIKTKLKGKVNLNELEKSVKQEIKAQGVKRGRSTESGAKEDFRPPYVYTTSNGAEAVSVPDLRKYIKQNNIIRIYQGDFRIYENGYYRQMDMTSFVYMEMPEDLRSSKTAEQVTQDLMLDTEIILNDKETAGEEYICFKNGVYDIRTKQLTEHNSERVFVSQVPHNYNPKAMPDATTESFLTNCCEADVKQRKLLLEIIGVTLSDVRSFKYWFFIQGVKDTGKSTFCGVLQRVLTDEDGTKHFSALPLNALDEDEFGLAEVLGKKANIVTDTSNDPIKNLTTIKKLTGGAYEELNCKVKYGVRNAKGVSKAILIFAGNDIPKLWAKGDKTAFLERMILLRFNIVVPKEKQIAGLVEKLDFEYLIKLGIEALHEFIDNNYIFTESESVINDRQEVLFESDNVYKFFKDACIVTPGEKVHIAHAYKIFMNWAYENGYSEKADYNPITVNTFRNSIMEYGISYERAQRIGEYVKPAFIDLKIKEEVICAYGTYFLRAN